MRCRVTLFSLSGWRSELLLRDFFSYLLRHIPEKGNEKDPLLSQGSGSIRSWSAQVAEVSSATCRKKKKEKKSLQNNPLPIPQKWSVQEEPGKLARKSQLLFLTLKQRTLKGEHRRNDFFYIYILFSEATLKEDGKRSWNQAEYMGMHVWNGKGPSRQQQRFQQNQGSDHTPGVLLEVSDPGTDQDCWDLSLRCEKLSAWAHRAARQAGFKQGAVECWQVVLTSRPSLKGCPAR